MKRVLLLFIPALFYCCNFNQVNKKEPVSGPYFGQTPPGNEAVVFAPGFINTGMATRDVAMTPDGKEFYFCVEVGNFRYSTILVTREENGVWTEPEVLEFMDDPDIVNIEPAISPDGKKLYFMSNRMDSASGDTAHIDQDIWVMNRVEEKWSEPYNLGEPVNSPDPEFYPSVTNTGTLYFTRANPANGIHHIYRSRFMNGSYQEVELLPEQVNSGRSQFNAYIARDESYIIVPVFGRADSFGGTDYYISFRDENDQWSDPFHIGSPVSSESRFEWSAYVSPDLNYLFFMSTRELDETEAPDKLTFSKLKEIYNQPNNGNVNIYWTSTGIIDSLKSLVN